MIVTISGIRDLDPDCDQDVINGIGALFRHRGPGLTELRFGGARGTDTLALRAAHTYRGDRSTPRLVVYLPCTRGVAPREARSSLSLADEVIEMGGNPGDKGSYLRRNVRMTAGADMLLAFADGETGGTGHAIACARVKGGVEVQVLAVRRCSS